jgi:hypothetical protein
MTKLYVANCSKFVQDFLFKLPGQTQINAYRATIPIGGQTLIMNRDIDMKTAMHIVQQHEKYGLISVQDLDRTKSYFGLCYRLDEEIEVEQIMLGIAHNEEVKDILAHENRKRMAVALSDGIDKMMQGSEAHLQGLEMELTELPKAGDNAPRKTEAIQVAKPGSKAAQRGAEKAFQAR